MENIEMIQDLVSKIKKQVKSEGLVSEAVTESLSKMRAYAIQDENPKLTKTIRLTLEHLEKENGFFISIPADEVIEIEEEEDEEEAIENETSNSGSTEDQLESFDFLLDLMADYKRPSSIQDIEAYKQALLAY
ncbi:hypothetical protein N9L20_06870 [Flavobacteriaceae bacterium]|nr:hypothetical protein [Flavobacteriaceae bacterium]